MGFDSTKLIIKPQEIGCYSNLLIGPSGSGKTYQFSTLLKAGFKVLYISTERKAATLAGLTFDMVLLDKPDYPRSASEAVPGASSLYDLLQYLREGKHSYDGVFLDSGMRYSEDMLDYLRRVKNLSGLDVWAAFAEKSERWLKAFTALNDPTLVKPIHVVVTWGVEMDKDWTGARGIQPLVDGQRVKPKVSYWFDNVLYLDKQDDPQTMVSDFVLYTTGKAGFSAKISSGRVKFPAVIKNPSLGEILLTLKRGNANEGSQAT